MPTRPAPLLSAADALAQLSFLVRDTLARRAAEQDVSMAQARLLGILRDRTPTMNELAALLDIDKSSATGLVTRAEARGLVRRTTSPSDRRAVLVELTPPGRRLVTRTEQLFTADVTEILSRLSARDRAALTELATRVLQDNARQREIELFP